MLHISPRFCTSLHIKKSDQNRPHVGAGFRYHQHSDQRVHVGPQYDRDVKTETQQNGKPHKTEAYVLCLFGALVKQNDDQESDQGERNIPINSPGQRRIRAGPLVLRKQAQNDSGGGKQIKADGEPRFSLYAIPYSPDIIQIEVINFPIPSGTA